MTDKSPEATSEKSADTATEERKTPQMMRFHRRAREPKLTPAEARRQGQITSLTLSVFSEKDGAIAFLNSHHATLGARPLDLAVKSDEGYAAVTAAIEGLRRETLED